jgi:hypothetical protein
LAQHHYRQKVELEKQSRFFLLLAGGYEDDEDAGDVLWYTGQGANDLQGDRKQVDSQKLVRGNLAFAKMLERRERGLEVRVRLAVGVTSPFVCPEPVLIKNRRVSFHINPHRKKHPLVFLQVAPVRVIRQENGTFCAIYI